MLLCKNLTLYLDDHPQSRKEMIAIISPRIYLAHCGV